MQSSQNDVEREEQTWTRTVGKRIMLHDFDPCTKTTVVISGPEDYVFDPVLDVSMIFIVSFIVLKTGTDLLT
jgi:hypothetical protein